MLKVDWCSHKAAKYAVERWHYSKSLPAGKLVKLGVWENNKFIGVVIFSRGASANLLKKYNLTQKQGCELTRVALAEHQAPVTKIVSISVNYLKRLSPSMRLIISFADPDMGHYGGIYQAGNWIYAGTSASKYDYTYKGRRLLSRQVSNSGFIKEYGEKRRCPRRIDCEKVFKQGKHRYLMPLDKQMRKQIEPLSLPYPKRGLIEEQQIPSVEGGASPTSTLHTQVQARQ
jgi:hypothetical protein